MLLWIQTTTQHPGGSLPTSQHLQGRSRPNRKMRLCEESPCFVQWFWFDLKSLYREINLHGRKELAHLSTKNDWNFENYAITGLLTSCNRLIIKKLISGCVRKLACVSLLTSLVVSWLSKRVKHRLATSICKRQVVTSLILTDLLQLDEIDKFVATCW